MEGRVTCNEEKCQQLDRAQINTEGPTSTSSPVLAEVTTTGSRIIIAASEETGEKGLTGNIGPPGEFKLTNHLSILKDIPSVKAIKMLQMRRRFYKIHYLHR